MDCRGNYPLPDFQELSFYRHAHLMMSIEKSGRLVAVGDCPNAPVTSRLIGSMVVQSVRLSRGVRRADDRVFSGCAEDQFRGSQVA